MKTILLILISTLLLSVSCTKDNPITANNGPKLYSFSAYLDDNMQYCANQFVAYNIKDSFLKSYFTNYQNLGVLGFSVLNVPLDSSHFINGNIAYQKFDTFNIECRIAIGGENGPFCLSQFIGPAPKLLFITQIRKK